MDRDEFEMITEALRDLMAGNAAARLACSAILAELATAPGAASDLVARVQARADGVDEALHARVTAPDAAVMKQRTTALLASIFDDAAFMVRRARAAEDGAP